MLLSVVPAATTGSTKAYAQEELTRNIFSTHRVGDVIYGKTNWEKIEKKYTVPKDVHAVWVGFHGVAPPTSRSNILAYASVKTQLLNDVYVSSKGDDDKGGGIKENPFKTIKQAYSWAAKGATIHIMDDLSVTEEIQFPESKSLNIVSDSNGNLNDGEKYTIGRDNSYTNGAMFTCCNGANINFSSINISGNKIKGGTAIAICDGSVTIGDNCEIKEHITTDGANDDGAVVSVEAGSTFTMKKGSSISQNTGSKPTVLVRSGGTIITDNHKGTAKSNVFIETATNTIRISDKSKLTPKANIGVSVINTPTKGNPVKFAKGNSEDGVSKAKDAFKSDILKNVVVAPNKAFLEFRAMEEPVMDVGLSPRLVKKGTKADEEFMGKEITGRTYDENALLSLATKQPNLKLQYETLDTLTTGEKEVEYTLIDERTGYNVKIKRKFKVVDKDDVSEDGSR